MDKEQDALKVEFGLIGRDIEYSFSRAYFAEKFEREGLDHTYVNFDLSNIDEFPGLVEKYPNIKGFNVTIPYKEVIIPLLDKLSKKARKIKAVNTIKVTKNGRLKGYNTDCYGFKKALTSKLNSEDKRALILGTGGASKAIEYVLNKLEIKYDFVSRNPENGEAYAYSEITDNLLNEYQIIINCTPLGTFPNVDSFPDIPYEALGKQHLLFDLVYNPPKTAFLRKGEQQGARISNGQSMLEYQAEKAWKIWMK